MTIFASIIIATYNRENCIGSSIESALKAFSLVNTKFEIIVIDDCSIDNTDLVVNRDFKKYIASGNLIYIKLPKNKGVCGARNFGVRHAHGEWVIFLDSDDTLLPESGIEVFKELNKYNDNPVVFFRCVDQNGIKVGNNFKDYSCDISLKDYLTQGSSGECLTAIKREAINTIKFEEHLRGYEGLTIAKIMRYTNKNAILSHVLARMYIQTGEDRLSSKSGFSKRLKLIGKGHFLMVKEFSTDMSMMAVLYLLIKSFSYQALHFLNTVISLTRK